MEECLRAVGANKECPTDEAFAFQVRLQLIVQRAVHIREQQEVDHAYAATAAAPLPTFLYLKTLQGQLQELRASLSPGLQHQGKRYRTSKADELACSKILQIIISGIADTSGNEQKFSWHTCITLNSASTRQLILLIRTLHY